MSRLPDPILEGGSESPPAFLIAAEAELIRGESLPRAGRDGIRAAVMRARSLARKAAAINPSLARAEALLAWAAALEAETFGGPETAKEGLEHLERAAALNPLDPDLDPLRARLAGIASRSAPAAQPSGSL